MFDFKLKGEWNHQVFKFVQLWYCPARPVVPGLCRPQL